MDAIRVNRNTRVNQVSSRTQLVRSDSNLIDFFIGDKMKTCPTKRAKKARQKANKKYRKTDKGKRAHCKESKKYKQSEKGKASQRLFRERHPNHIKAANAVNHAIVSHKIPRPDVQLCHYCYKRRAKEYHHYFGYEPIDWFKIRPVCRICHRKIHLKIAI